MVVTYNRKALLAHCLEALHAQTRQPDRILVVDNASTDGTVQALEASGWLARPGFELLRLADNTGGAGGFQAGVLRALGDGADWVWMMDDDAMPRHDALQALMAVDPDPASLYGSVAVQGSTLVWPMERADAREPARIEDLAQAPAVCDVLFLPFLGLLASAPLVRRIGPPDASLFLAVDDVEFCLRARRTGARVHLVSASRIDHPLAHRTAVRVGWRTVYTLRLPPWKRYYDVRNRLLVARAHHGAALWYAALPGTLLRWVVTLLTEPERGAQCRAFFGGVVDGLLNRRGRRHDIWLAS